jgi:hypothetical protein
MEERNIYFVTTRNCNLKCDHCYMSAGPGLKDTTISSEDFKKVIDHLPKIPIFLTLTGGEIFTVPDSLFSFLGHIKNANKKRRSKHQIILQVQTNAFWAMKKDPIPILENLANFGVKYLDITSDDEFHEEQGIDRSKLSSLKSLAQRYFNRITIRGIRSTKGIMPVGRSRSDGIGTKYLEGAGCEKTLDKSFLCIDEIGEVYPCCYNFFKFPGNLIDEPLTTILKRVREDKRLSKLDQGGPIALARSDGISETNINKLVENHGECGACFELFSKDCKY